MSNLSLTVTPASAADAYARVDSVDGGASGTGFDAVLNRAMQSVVDTGHKADGEAMKAIAGGGSITDLAASVSRAELALQTAVSIRDRVVQAYQDVARMSI